MGNCTDKATRSPKSASYSSIILDSDSDSDASELTALAHVDFYFEATEIEFFSNPDVSAATFKVKMTVGDGMHFKSSDPIALHVDPPQQKPLENRRIKLQGQTSSLINFALVSQQPSSSSDNGPGAVGALQWRTDQRLKFNLALFDDEGDAVERVDASSKIRMDDLVNSSDSEGVFGDIHFMSSAFFGDATTLAVLRGTWKRAEKSTPYTAIPFLPRHAAATVVDAEQSCWVVVATASSLSVGHRNNKQQQQKRPGGSYRIMLELPTLVVVAPLMPTPVSTGRGAGDGWSETSLPLQPTIPADSDAVVRVCGLYPADESTTATAKTAASSRHVTATVRLLLSTLADAGRHNGKQSPNGDLFTLEATAKLDIGKLFRDYETRRRNTSSSTTGASAVSSSSSSISVKSFPVTVTFEQFGSVVVVVEVCEDAKRESMLDWVTRAGSGISSVQETIATQRRSGALTAEQEHAAFDVFSSWMNKLNVAASPSEMEKNSTAILDFVSAFFRSRNLGPAATFMLDALAAVAHHKLIGGTELDAQVKAAVMTHTQPSASIVAQAASSGTECAKWIGEHAATGLASAAPVVPYVGPLLGVLAALYDLLRAAKELKEEIAAFQRPVKAMLSMLAQEADKLVKWPPTNERMAEVRRHIEQCVEIADTFLARGWLMQRATAAIVPATTTTTTTTSRKPGSRDEFVMMRKKFDKTQHQLFQFLTTYQLDEIREQNERLAAQVLRKENEELKRQLLAAKKQPPPSPPLAEHARGGSFSGSPLFAAATSSGLLASSTFAQEAAFQPHQEQCGFLNDTDFWSSFDMTAPDAMERLVRRFPMNFVYKSSDIQVLNTIHEGGFGMVARALLKPGGLDEGWVVAAKLFKDKDSIRSAVREAENSLKFRNKNVITTHGISFAKGGFGGLEAILLSELGDCDLGAVLKRGVPSWSWCVRSAKQMAEGLAYLHTRKPNRVLHLDLKPANVIVFFNSGGASNVTPGCEAQTALKLCDFGLSVSTSHEKTQASKVAFTLRYAPPEQLHSTEVSPRCDVYSFGAILFYFVTGSEPWAGCDRNTIAHGNLADFVCPRDGCPQKLLDACKRCLCASATGRPADGVELVRMLADDGDELPHFCMTGDEFEVRKVSTLRNMPSAAVVAPSSPPTAPLLLSGSGNSSSSSATNTPEDPTQQVLGVTVSAYAAGSIALISRKAQ